jgi:hypothetical protein
MKSPMVCAAVFLVASVCTAHADSAKLEDISKVLEALKAAGCTSLIELDVKSDGYKLGGVACNDSQVYDMKMSKTFEIVKKRKDWF